MGDDPCWDLRTRSIIKRTYGLVWILEYTKRAPDINISSVRFLPGRINQDFFSRHKNGEQLGRFCGMICIWYRLAFVK
jgi:hypothetical protein